MKFKNLIYVCAFSVVLYTCSSSSGDDLNDDKGQMPAEKVTYLDDTKSIIDNNCTQCHGNTPTNGAPFSLTTFDDVKNRIDRIIARVNSASNPMPPSGQINADLRAQIEQWKADGLLEN
ncbi:hypothetical protein [Algibacter sp. 2305UL17-15]|uniref:hypothetical protein n=1 Tax=Algibacter sp. 2305UL17-15 TaxID=3231268 RepID=UPI0034592D69